MVAVWLLCPSIKFDGCWRRLMTLNIPHQPSGGSLSLNTGHRPQLSRGSPPTGAWLLPCSVLRRTRALHCVRLEQRGRGEEWTVRAQILTSSAYLVVVYSLWNCDDNNSIIVTKSARLSHGYPRLTPLTIIHLPSFIPMEETHCPDRSQTSLNTV